MLISSSKNLHDLWYVDGTPPSSSSIKTFTLDFYPAAQTSSRLESNKCHSKVKTDLRFTQKMDTLGVFDLKIDLEKSH
jgi:hypothetical protein